METVQECVSCQEIGRVSAVMHYQEVECITNRPGFKSGYLDPWVLQIAYYGYRQQYGDMPQQGNQ